MKTIEIKHRYTSAVLYTTEVEDSYPNPLRTAVVRAVAAGANLAGANLDGANLAYANLAYADLAYADLARAYLAGANLAGANLARANLAGAYLAGANLADANLADADLAGIREDFRAVLDTSPNEVAGLLVKLRAGEVDGSQYEGECSCLVGTIATLRATRYYAMIDLRPDSTRPSERWFLAIRRGCTPDNHPVAAITEDWILEWQAERGEGDFITAEE